MMRRNILYFMPALGYNGRMIQSSQPSAMVAFLNRFSGL
jgi:hypothetical protein